MTLVSVSSQGALSRPRSPASSRRRPIPTSQRHILHFHFKDPAAATLPPVGSYITLAHTSNSSHSVSGTYYTSQLFLPQLTPVGSLQVQASSSFRSGIPRSSSGLYPTGRRLSGVVLHPVNLAPAAGKPPLPPQSILVLPGSAKSRIRQHQAREEAVRRKTIHNPEGLSEAVDFVTEKNEKMAATAVHLSNPPPSTTSTPHHIHHHIAPAPYHTYTGYYAQQNGRSSPSVIVTDTVSHVHPPEHFIQSGRPTIGYPGGAHGTNQVVIRVIQKPVEALMVDGDNPFRPDSDLYKEADELIKEYTLPRGSASPSPMPVSSATSQEYISTHVQQLTPQPKPNSVEVKTETQFCDARSTTVTNCSSSPAPTNGSTTKETNGKESKVRPSLENDKENIHHGQKPDHSRPRGKSNSSAEEEMRPDTTHVRDGNNARNHEENGPLKKDRKKKRKPVGCGGDKSCSIM